MKSGSVMMINRMMYSIVAVVVTALILVGCASSQSSSSYTRTQARQAQQVQYGTVRSVRQVNIEGTKSAAGAVTGAAIGGLAGNQVGGGAGRTAATVGGVLLGAYAGAAAEEAVTRQPGLEIEILLDNGRIVSVTQAADEPFAPDERVRLLTAADGTARVAH